MKITFTKIESHLKSNEFEQAIKKLNQIIEQDSQNKLAFKLLGNAYFLQNDYKKALINYRKAIKIDSEFAEPYNNIGLIFSDELKIKKSFFHFKKAIALKPDFIDAYYNRALLFEKIGDFNQAIADYSKVIEINPNEDEAITARRRIVNERGFYQTVIEYQLAKLKLAKKDKVGFELLIAIPNFFFESLDHFDRIVAIIDFVNEARRLGQGDYLPANAWESYFLDYYVSQVHNGGINQFIANSKLDQFMVKNIKNGLANIGAKRNLDLFNELLSKNIQLKESENGYSEQEIIEGYVKFAQRVNPITELLRNQFYQIEQTEPISKLNHSYIGTFTNLEIFPNVNLNE